MLENRNICLIEISYIFHWKFIFLAFRNPLEKVKSSFFTVFWSAILENRNLFKVEKFNIFHHKFHFFCFKKYSCKVKSSYFLDYSSAIFENRKIFWVEKFNIFHWKSIFLAQKTSLKSKVQFSSISVSYLGKLEFMLN